MGCPPVSLTDVHVSSCPSHLTIPWDLGTFHGMSTCPSHRSAVHPIPLSHGTIGHSTGCPLVPLTDACVSHCPSHPTIPWDQGTFHGMSTSPSNRCACILLSIPSHDPMGSWDIPWDVHLSLSQKRVYPTVHPTIPSWDHGTFHGMSTCPAHRSGCILLSIPSHDPMGCPPVPLTEARESSCPSHPTIQWDHGIFHGMSTCPSHRCVCILLSIPSHDPMGPWDIPWDVHLSLSQMCVYSAGRYTGIIVTPR